MHRLSSASAVRLETASSALLDPVGAEDWSRTVLGALRTLLRADHVALVLGTGERMQFYGHARAVALLRHTHARSGTRVGPIFQRGFWLHSSPHHAGLDPRPHDAVGLCDVIDVDDNFVGACCTFAEPLVPVSSRARLRLLKAIRPALKASARQHLLRLTKSTDLGAMLEVVGDAAALVTPSGEIVQASRQLRELLEMDGTEQAIREVVSSLDARASRLNAESSGASASRCCSEVRSGAGSYKLRCCPMPGEIAGGRRLILVTLCSQRLKDLPTAADLVKQFGLTRRECDVAFELYAGKSNAEVAEALGISAFTARHHTERVLMKLGVRTRAAVNSSLRALEAAIAGGARLPVRSLLAPERAEKGAKRQAKPRRSEKARAAQVTRSETLADTPAAPGSKGLRPHDEPPHWHYDSAYGESGSPIAPRAD